MEGERKQNDTTCRGGCGFFGSSATNGLCSLCYKQQLAKMNAAPTTSAQSPAQVMASTPSPSIMKVDEEGSGSLQLSKELYEAGCSAESEKEAISKVTAELDLEDAQAKKKEDKQEEGLLNPTPAVEKKSKTNRCVTCRKKVGLLGFECRCGGLFCGTHRYSDKHDCSFDYREYGKTEIQKNNPVVVAEKIQKL